MIARVPLAQITQINPKLPKDTDESQHVSFLALASVSEDGRILEQETRVLAETKKGYTYFERGDVLLAKITPCFENGKAALVDNLEYQIGYGSTEFHVLRADPELLDSKYLFYMVWSDQFRFLGEKSMQGAAGQKRVSADFVKQFEIPLPPLAEQKRIAAILDKADALRRKRQQAIDLADQFLRSVFFDMFGDPVTNPKGWPTKPLSQMASVVTGYPFKSADYVDESAESVRLCRGANVLPGTLDWKDARFWPQERLEGLEEYLIEQDDIVLAMDRPWISSGLKVCSVNVADVPMYLVQRVARIRARNQAMQDLIYASIDSIAFERHCCPTETTIPHISPVELKAYPIFDVPPDMLELYSQVVRTTKRKLKHFELAELESIELFASLSQKAFSGQL